MNKEIYYNFVDMIFWTIFLFIYVQEKPIFVIPICFYGARIIYTALSKMRKSNA